MLSFEYVRFCFRRRTLITSLETSYILFFSLRRASDYAFVTDLFGSFDFDQDRVERGITFGLLLLDERNFLGEFSWTAHHERDSCWNDPSSVSVFERSERRTSERARQGEYVDRRQEQNAKKRRKKQKNTVEERNLNDEKKTSEYVQMAARQRCGLLSGGLLSTGS